MLNKPSGHLKVARWEESLDCDFPARSCPSIVLSSWPTSCCSHRGRLWQAQPKIWDIQFRELAALQTTSFRCGPTRWWSAKVRRISRLVCHLKMNKKCYVSVVKNKLYLLIFQTHNYLDFPVEVCLQKKLVTIYKSVQVHNSRRTLSLHPTSNYLNHFKFKTTTKGNNNELPKRPCKWSVVWNKGAFT